MALFTEAWAARLCGEINASEPYAAAARGWRWPIALTVEGEGHLLLDLREGRCHSARVVDTAAARSAPYEITASRDTWLEALEGRLDPAGAVLARRIRLRGDTMVVMRFLPAARELLACARRVGLPAES